MRLKTTLSYPPENQRDNTVEFLNSVQSYETMAIFIAIKQAL